MHLVEKLRGQGLVLRSNHLPLHGIGYDLTIWREPLQYGRDRRTTVARRIEGRVDVNTTDVFTLMDSEVPLSLVLEVRDVSFADGSKQWGAPWRHTATPRSTRASCRNGAPAAGRR